MSQNQNSAQRGSSSRLAKVALPKYVKNWPRGVYRPWKLPDGYNKRIDSNHIFALPENIAKETGHNYIIPYPCKRCVRSKQLCSRGEPCARCSQLGLESSCKPKDQGWLPLQVLPAQQSDETVTSPESTNNAPSRSNARRLKGSSAEHKTPGKLENASEIAVSSFSTRKSARILRVQNMSGSLSARALRAEERAMKFLQLQQSTPRSSGVISEKIDSKDASGSKNKEKPLDSRAYISRTSSLSSLTESTNAVDLLSSPLSGSSDPFLFADEAH
jgi:hypothetical protein